MAATFLASLRSIHFIFQLLPVPIRTRSRNMFAIRLIAQSGIVTFVYIFRRRFTLYDIEIFPFYRIMQITFYSWHYLASPHAPSYVCAPRNRVHCAALLISATSENVRKTLSHIHPPLIPFGAFVRFAFASRRAFNEMSPETTAIPSDCKLFSLRHLSVFCRSRVPIDNFYQRRADTCCCPRRRQISKLSKKKKNYLKAKFEYSAEVG